MDKALMSYTAMVETCVGRGGKQGRTPAMKEPSTSDCIILQCKAVVRLYADKHNIPEKQAGIIFSKSETARILSDESSGLWTESEYYILEYFEKEIAGIPRNLR